MTPPDPLSPLSSAAAPTRTLARCVGDVTAFATHVWGRRSQVHPSGVPADDLLSLDDVDALVTSSALRVPTFRLVKDGRPLPVASYTTDGTIGGRRYDGVAAPAKVLAAMDDGATLVLQGAHRYHPPLARLARDLEVALGHRCQVNAYVTPPGARGLEVHADPHDVLVLQAFGTKTWEVHPTPWQSRHEPDAGVVEQVLVPGDVQYLPAGTPHAARSQDVLSGHVTVGVLTTSWADVVQDVVRAVLDDPTLDDGTLTDGTGLTGPLPVGWHEEPDRAADALADRLHRVADALRTHPAGPVLRQRAETFLRHRPALLAGALVDRTRLPGLDDATVLERRPGAVLRVVPGPDADRLRLLLGDRALDVPARLAPAVEVVARRDRLSPADLAGVLDAESRLVLCRRLVREGLLRVATPAAGPGAGR